MRLTDELRQHAAALADTDRRKNEFLAMLSHELRNPLAAITNAVHLLRAEGGGTRRQQQAGGIIERQAGQLARLVNDLLEVSRITTGRVRLEQERVDVRQVVERAVGTVQPLIDRAGRCIFAYRRDQAQRPRSRTGPCLGRSSQFFQQSG